MKPLALTMGDPAGIGGEITLKAWQALRATGPCFVLLADPILIPAQAGTQTGSAESVGLGARFRGHDGGRCIGDISEAPSVFSAALPILPVSLAAPVVPGRSDQANAPGVIASIEQATRLALSGEAAAIVTNPISKAVLYDAGFRYPGHTEFLAALTGVPGREVMMLASPLLRVVPVTVHVSLRDALATLTTEGIVAAARTTQEALRTDFGIAAPRLAVAGLNPHAGEGGAMGSEEATIIMPAIERLRADGIEVSGPWPPDTMFTEAARARYDAAICMYHDQALIPLKTLDMRSGVNVTLGLPIVRTSPDHGTAFDIAGKGIAEPDSLIAALRLAGELAATRARRPAR